MIPYFVTIEKPVARGHLVTTFTVEAVDAKLHDPECYLHTKANQMTIWCAVTQK